MLDITNKVYTLNTAKFLYSEPWYLCISVGIMEEEYQIGGIYSFPSNHSWDKTDDVTEVSYYDLHEGAVRYFDAIFNVEDQLKSIFKI